MTIAVLVKVHDGLVLAADSATTVQLADGSAQVYNNADKIFNLHRELPIAAMTWGLGSVGPSSVSTVAKDLRRRLMGQEAEFDDWELDKGSYTVEGVAKRVAEIFHTKLSEAPGVLPENCLGLLVCGYSGNASQSEAWVLFLDGNAEDPPAPILVASPDDVGWLAWGQPQALHRLFHGHDGALRKALIDELPKSQHKALEAVLGAQGLQPVFAAMPFPDAIELAKFCVQVTAGFAHFLLGPDTVGGPTEVAGVNRHEGFKWVSRKHYYSPEMNPGSN